MTRWSWGAPSQSPDLRRAPAARDRRARIRKAIGVKQAEFAARCGFNIASVRDWEQGRSRPTGPVRVFMVIEREREAVERALRLAA
jgi:DNA-binding transcriptional regulator YiaG